jgi:hypothetical protein
VIKWSRLKPIAALFAPPRGWNALISFRDNSLVGPISRKIKITFSKNCAVITGFCTVGELFAGTLQERRRACEVIVEPGYILGPFGDEIFIDGEVVIDVCKDLDGNVAGLCAQPTDPWCIFDVRSGIGVPPRGAS